MTATPDVWLATSSRLLLALARLDVAPGAYRRLASAVPLVGRDALRHDDTLRSSPIQWACWASKLRYLYSSVVRYPIAEGDLNDFLPYDASDEVGMYQWRLYAREHRDCDLPAAEYDDGSKTWYRHGKIHRDGDRPAIVHSDGHSEWWHNGKIHRDGDLPAVDDTRHRFQQWYCNGRMHRDDDKPAYVAWYGDIKMWWRDGVLHRDSDLPAYTSDHGIAQWWRNGAKLRETTTYEAPLG